MTPAPRRLGVSACHVVLEILPFLTWLASITSLVLLIALWRLGELGPACLMLLSAVSLLAGYLQFFGGSPLAASAGLALQTTVAVGLILRWKLVA
jgi:hypothetical protein